MRAYESMEAGRRLSLHGLLAGVLVTLTAQVVLMLLGTALGIGAGAGFWVWTLAALSVGSYLGGWVTTTVSRAGHPRDGLLQGLVTGATVSLLGLGLLSAVIGNVEALLPIRAGMEAPSALALWGVFLAQILPICAAVFGGYAGARSEVRFVRKHGAEEIRPPAPTIPQPTA